MSVTICEVAGNGRVDGGCDTSFGVRSGQGMQKVLVHLRRTVVDRTAT